jgi:lipoprotein NlpD
VAGTLSCSSKPHSPAPVTELSRKPVYSKEQRGVLKAEKYTVKKGETLYAIAFAAGTDVRTLSKLNNIPDPYIIHPGQTLRLRPSTLSTSQKTEKKPIKSKVGSKIVTQPSPKVVDSTNRKHYSGKGGEKTTKLKPAPSETYPSKVSGWRWPSQGKVISWFSSKEQGTKGLDFAGSKGDPVYAAADGKVVYAGGALRGFGQLIIIKHSEDYLSAYAHNSKLRVSEQQWVRAGQHIADMGDSGAESVKLHFEIRYRGTSVNPIRYLPKR